MPPYHRPLVSRSILLLLLLAIPASARDDRGAGTHSRDASLFPQDEYLGHIRYLASDELEGRGTGQEGIDKAAEYIADYFEKFGVEPAGDDGTYFQNFTLKLRKQIGEGTRLAVGLEGRRTRAPAKLRQDFVPFPFSGNGAFKGDVVFAGYGMVEEDFNEYEGLDVSGKVVLVMRRAPRFRDFGFMPQSFRAKARKAAARDAAAVIVVNPPDDEEGDKLFEFDGPSAGGGMFGSRSVGLPLVQVRREVAERMLKSAGLPGLADLQKQIEETKKPVSAALKGVSVKGAVKLEQVESPVRNIVGLIPGTGPQKEEIIILGGHYDHLGIRNKGQEGFDPAKDISNGADDNASGTALVMNMARVYTQGQRPNRSILLMLFTAEELGLLGSYHFVNNPTVDLEKVVAMLNFDMVGRLKNDKLEVGGMRTGGFEEMVLRMAKPYGLKIKDGGGGRGPSDHTSFYNKKIPVLFFFTGIHKQYHQPTDDTPLINAEGAIRIARFAADIVDEIDARPERPTFTADTSRATIARQDDEETGQPQRPGIAERMRDRPRLGIRPDMDAEEQGVVIAEVIEGGVADKAGLKAGDCIVRIGKAKIEAMEDLMEAMGKIKPGDRVGIEARRGARTIKVTAQFGERRQDAIAARPTEGVKVEQIADLLAAVKKALEDKDRSVEVSIRVEPGKPDGYEITLRVRASGAARRAEGREERAESAPRRGAEPAREQRKARSQEVDAHGGDADADERAEMPPVRLGIMPSYGESEGEGYEISGVVDGGPAAKAGMKDSDRIYKIGDRKITDVYGYMDALRKYKPGDVVEVVVIRDGRKVTLKIRTAPQKSREAA